MTEPEFERTLDIPQTWIEELTGLKYDASTPLALSYFPTLKERLAEIGCTIADIEADFANGYFLQKKPATGGNYYILESASFKIWANPKSGQKSGGRLVALTRIDVHPQPIAIAKAPFRGISLRPVWEEVPGSVDAHLALLEAYRNAHSTLDSPPPFERNEATEGPDDTRGLWRYQALGELLEILRRRSKLTPPITVEGNVLASDGTTWADAEADRVLRVETDASLKGWRADTRVNVEFPNGRVFATQIREIDGKIIEMDAPDGPLPKVGEHAKIEQETRFALSAHKRALKQFLDKELAGNWDDLRALLAAPKELVPGTRPAVATDGEVLNDDLTEEQRRAVDGAVLTPHAFFIQGPPGTGKTTVITEIVQRLVRRGERVLLLSTTHVAVDEVLRRVAKKSSVLPVRLSWDATKVEPSLRGFVYETARNALVGKVLQRREDSAQFWTRRKAQLDADVGRIEALERIENRWLAAGQEPGAETAFEEEIGTALLQAANLICATTVGVAKQKFAHIGNVDTLIVDEASRVTDAEFLIGAVRAKRWILVGDEHQLPPHVEPSVEYLLLAMVACSMVDRNLAPDLPSAVERLAQEWAEEEQLHAFRVQSVLDIAEPLHTSDEWERDYRRPFNLALDAMPEDGDEPHRELIRLIRHFLIQSTFERGVAACPKTMRIRLSEQRRMIDPIARFVRKPIYQGAYRSPDAAILNRLGVRPFVSYDFPCPVTFLNTAFRRKEAAEKLVGTGFINELEARWIADACDHFENELNQRRNPGQTSVSILCFYREQSRLIRSLLDKRAKAHQKLQFRVIDAIDRIQGQESDVVFISFCRARPPRHELSEKFGLWLRDPRRLNVAFTRARRALVLVGHKPTLEKLGKYQPFYEHLFDLFENHSSDMQMVHDFGERRKQR